jgi:predicted ATP-grasp superfamily ATP-dependent carboligase
MTTKSGPVGDSATLPPAIVIGVDSPIGLTVIRELGKRGVPVIGVGSSKYSVGGASRYLKHFFRRPETRTIAEWLPGLIRQYDAKAVLAISESDLLQLAEMPDDIEGCQILTPRQPQLGEVLDKSRTMAVARDLGLDTPDSWQPSAEDDFAEIARVLAYPLAIKWNDPQAIGPVLSEHQIAFEKIEYAANAEELLGILRRYDNVQAWPLVQSYCPGTGFGQMLLMRNGKAALTFQHRRLHEWPVTGGVSTLCTNEAPERHRDQLAKSEKLLRAINWDGPAMVEYRYDPETGRYCLMEVNGRFWGSLPLAHHSGAFFAWETYAGRILGLEVDETSQSSRSIKACYLIPETKRLAQILRQDVEPKGYAERIMILGGYIRDRLNPRMHYYIFSWRDPKPCIVDMIGIIVRLRHRGK